MDAICIKITGLNKFRECKQYLVMFKLHVRQKIIQFPTNIAKFILQNCFPFGFPRVQNVFVYFSQPASNSTTTAYVTDMHLVCRCASTANDLFAPKRHAYLSVI